VGVKTDDGILTARKIILASGGFGASAELLSKYIPKAFGIPFPGHHGSTGDGIKMGLEIGAAIENMGAFQPYPAYRSGKARGGAGGGAIGRDHGRCRRRAFCR